MEQEKTLSIGISVLISVLIIAAGLFYMDVMWVLLKSTKNLAITIFCVITVIPLAGFTFLSPFVLPKFIFKDRYHPSFLSRWLNRSAVLCIIAGIGIFLKILIIKWTFDIPISTAAETIGKPWFLLQFILGGAGILFGGIGILTRTETR